MATSGFITNWKLNEILKLGLEDQDITQFAIDNAKQCEKEKQSQHTDKDCRETTYKVLVNNSIRNVAARFFHKIGFNVYDAGQSSSFVNGGIELGEGKKKWDEIADELGKLVNCDKTATRKVLPKPPQGKATAKAYLFGNMRSIDDYGGLNLGLVSKYGECNPESKLESPKLELLKILKTKDANLVNISSLINPFESKSNDNLSGLNRKDKLKQLEKEYDPSIHFIQIYDEYGNEFNWHGGNELRKRTGSALESIETYDLNRIKNPFVVIYGRGDSTYERGTHYIQKGKKLFEKRL